jgi:phosphatidylinositol phospholipase C delta
MGKPDQEHSDKNWFWSLFGSAEHPEARISDELAEYGYYARSMKPREGWLLQSKVLSCLSSTLF